MRWLATPTRPGSTRFIWDAAVTAALGLVIGVLLVVDPAGVGWRADDPVTVALVLLGLLPYLIRSRTPLLALMLAAITLVALTEHGDSVGVLGAGSFLLAFTVGYAAPRRHVVVACVAVAAMIAYLWWRGPTMTVAVALNNVLMFTASFALGALLRRRRREADWAVERAELLDRERVLAEERADLLERERVLAEERAVGRERLRIARDLHDITGHTLGVIAVQAGVAAHVMDAEPDEAKAALVSIAASSRASLQDVRAMVTALRETDQPDRYDPAPGLAELPDLIDGVREVGQEVTLAMPDPMPDVAAPLGVAVHRIVQQALSNALEHAPGVPVDVRVASRPGRLEVEIANPLPDRERAAPRPGHGYGLLSMAERAHLAGGRLRAGPDGSRFRVWAGFETGAMP